MPAATYTAVLAQSPDEVGWLSVTLMMLLVIVLAVGVHYTALGLIDRAVSRLRLRHGRMVLVIYSLLIAHAIEIQLFALSYMAIDRLHNANSLSGATQHTYADYAYFSAAVYTTLGFGDITPVDALRIMVGMEALTGFVMITWSASFTYMTMHDLHAFRFDAGHPEKKPK